MSLEGMVFVITGGSSGIGAATAAVAAESGAKVVIGSRSVDRGSEVVREIAAGGGQAILSGATSESSRTCGR
jgi:NAD(P)-dependent dehydrogenase (short-subunit alcohol dehydrogenase family)